MADIAELGFRVDSSGLVRAASDLDRLNRAASSAANNRVRIAADVSGVDAALREIERLAVNRSIRIDANVTGISEALRDLDRLSGGARSVRIDVGINGVEAAVRGLRDIERLAVNRTVRIDIDLGDVGGAIRDLERLAQQARDAAAEINGLGSNVNVTSGAVGGLGGVMSSLMSIISVAVIADATSDLIKYNAELNLLNSYLGVTREAMQVWGAAGKAVGVEIADVFKDVQEKIGEFAATGGGEAKDVFAKLKLDVNDLIALSPDQQLLKIADAMSKITDMSMGEKSFLLESLGNDATRLLPLLENNAAKLRELDEIMRNSGSIITDEQNAVLEEAYSNMTLLQAASEGATNALGMAGAELLNVFAGDAIDAISGVGESIYVLIDEAYLVADAWSSTTGLMSDDSSAAADAISGAFDWLFGAMSQRASDMVELFRIGFTYLPNFAVAAFQAMIDYSMSWVHAAAAGFDAVKAAAGGALASAVDFAGKAFGAIQGIAGQVIGYVIGRLADMAAAIGGALSSVASVPGMEGLSANVAGVEARLRGLAGAAKSTGAAVTSSFSAMAGSIRAAANESSASAKISALQATTSKLSAQHALANASAMMVESEGNRARTIEMGKAERQFARLGSSLDSAGAAGKKFRVDQDAVNKALEDGGGKAGKAAKAVKGKSDADKEAAKAARELEQAQKKIADAYDREYERLESQIIKYRDGEEALYQYKLTKDNLTDGMKSTLTAMKAEADALEDQHKAREKTQKAYEKATESLDDEYAKLTLSTEGYIRNKLAVDGVTGAKQDELAARQMAVDKLSEETKAYKKAADNLLNAFDDAIMQGKNLFDGLKDWVSNLFNDLVLKPVLQPITSAISNGVNGMMTGKSNPWEGLKNAGMQTWSGMQAGGMTGAFTAAGAAGGLVGLLGGTQSESIGASIGAGIGNVLLPGLGGVIGGALGGLAGSLFGGKWENSGAGLSLQYGAGDVSGQSYIESTKKGGLFSSTKRKTEYTALESALDQQLDAYFDAIESGIVSQSGSLVKLGISGGTAAAQGIVDGFTASLQKLDLTGKSDAERQTIIDAWANGIADDLYRAVIGADTFAQLDALAINGEATGDTIARLVTQFTTLNTIARNLDLQFNATGTAALTAANSLAGMFGGLQNLTTATDFYYQNFFSEEERKGKLLQAANDDLYDWNTTLQRTGDAAIDTAAEMRAYVSSLDLTTEAGQKAYYAAMGYAQAVLTVASAQTAAATATKSTLETARDAQAEQQAIFGQFTDSLSVIKDDYSSALSDLTDSYSEQISIFGKLQTAAKSLRDSVDKLKLNSSLTTLTPVKQLEEALRQFDALVAAAPTDATAAGQVASAGEQYLQLLRAYSASGDDYTAGFGHVTSAMDSVASEIESLRDPQLDMLAAQRDLLSRADSQIENLVSIYAGIIGGNDLARLAMEQAVSLPAELSGLLAVALQSNLGTTGTASVTDAQKLALAVDAADNFSNAGAQVISLFGSILGRNPQQEGLNYWRGELSKGVSLNDVAARIADSDEAKNRQSADLIAELKAMRQELAQLRTENAQYAQQAAGQRDTQINRTERTESTLARTARMK